MPRLARICLTACVLVLLASSTGCARATLEYIPEGGSYTMTELEDLVSTLDIGDVTDLTAADAAGARVERLASLRREGERAVALADALTEGFPTDSASVPVRVEAATVDGQSVWVVVEAWGEPGARLTHRRLWLLDYETLEIVSGSSFT